MGTVAFIRSALSICRRQNLTVPESVIKAMREIPRERFMINKYREAAWKDEPFPIHGGQTISAPHMVMMMLTRELFDPRPDLDVLEIGTGSGYNAAILSKVFRHVTTVERKDELVEFARKNLQSIGVSNVDVLKGDGTAITFSRKYDRIMVTAGAPYIPDNLIELLDSKGILLIPAKDLYGHSLVKVVKERGTCNYLKEGSKFKGKVNCITGPAVKFVPLLGEDGY